MPKSQEFQGYAVSALQPSLGQDGITYVHTPTGEVLHTIAWFSIPNRKLDKEAVDRLVSEFRSGAGRNAKKAICSGCYDKGKRVVRDLKPTSLKTHLYTHYKIKRFVCSFPSCDRFFVAKDQALVHVMAHHLGGHAMAHDRKRSRQERAAAASHVLSLY